MEYSLLVLNDCVRSGCPESSILFQASEWRKLTNVLIQQVLNFQNIAVQIGLSRTDGVVYGTHENSSLPSVVIVTHRKLGE
jgi:hypothetical protein